MKNITLALSVGLCLALVGCDKAEKAADKTVAATKSAAKATADGAKAVGAAAADGAKAAGNAAAEAVATTANAAGDLANKAGDKVAALVDGSKEAYVQTVIKIACEGKEKAAEFQKAAGFTPETWAAMAKEVSKDKDAASKAMKGIAECRKAKAAK